MNKKEKKIDLGYIALEGWTREEGLIQDWMREDGEAEPDKNEIVLKPSTDYTVKITYPLSNPFVSSGRTPSTGVSRIDLVEIIVNLYKQIYDEEDKTSVDKAGNLCGLYNRNRTTGKYGIWGHGLGDLMLHTAYIDKDGTITVGVDS